MNIKGSQIAVIGDSGKIEGGIHFHKVVSLESKDIEKDSKRLLEKIDEYFNLVAETLHDNPELQENALK